MIPRFPICWLPKGASHYFYGHHLLFIKNNTVCDLGGLFHTSINTFASCCRCSNVNNTCCYTVLTWFDWFSAFFAFIWGAPLSTWLLVNWWGLTPFFRLHPWRLTLCRKMKRCVKNILRVLRLRELLFPVFLKSIVLLKALYWSNVCPIPTPSTVSTRTLTSCSYYLLANVLSNFFVRTHAVFMFRNRFSIHILDCNTF